MGLPGRGLGLGVRQDERERYRLARQWRREHELPERVFYRVPVERKPTAADFRSIVLVNLLAKHIRQTQAAGHTEYTVTEMLPDTDQLWLTDRQGRRYSSELRIIAYDSRPEDHPSQEQEREREQEGGSRGAIGEMPRPRPDVTIVKAENDDVRDSRARRAGVQPLHRAAVRSVDHWPHVPLPVVVTRGTR